MIDTAGNKIYDNKHSIDLPFLLKEIDFFSKHFLNNPNDHMATTIAESINLYLTHEKKPDKIKNALKIIEEHSTRTMSDSLVWILVYIRRKMAEISETFENDVKSAEHFRRICEINPTTFNKCAEVIEITYILPYCKTVADANKYLKKAESLFKEIEFSTEPIYLKAFRAIYDTRASMLSKNKISYCTRDEHIENAADLSRYFFKKTDSEEFLMFSIYRYRDYIDTSSYSLEKESAYLDELLDSFQKNEKLPRRYKDYIKKILLLTHKLPDTYKS